MSRPGIRQALLKPDYAHLYPGIPANEWYPAAVMTDLVLSLRLRSLHRVPLTRERALNDAHFEFRGVSSAGANDAIREDRQEERRRRITEE